MKSKSFIEQQYHAKKIKDIKSRQWTEIAAQFMPRFTAEYLFYPTSSHLASMLKVDPEQGYIYDPETLENGIDMLMKILTNKLLPQGRIERMYSSFEDPITRISYLKAFIFQLELCPKLAKCMIDDLTKIEATLSDPEEIEINQNIKSILEREMSKNINYENQPE